MTSPRHDRQPRGFTVVELVVAITLGALLGTLAVRMLLAAWRVQRSLVARAEASRTLRTFHGVLTAELLPVAAGPDGDVLRAEPTVLRYRAVRGLYRVCVGGGTPGQVVLTEGGGEPGEMVAGTPGVVSDVEHLLVGSRSVDPGTGLVESTREAVPCCTVICLSLCNGAVRRRGLFPFFFADERLSLFQGLRGRKGRGTNQGRYGHQSKDKAWHSHQISLGGRMPQHPQNSHGGARNL